MGNGIKIGIVVVVLLAAGYFGWRNFNKIDPSSEIFDKTLYFLCNNGACKNEFEMTQRQVLAASKNGVDLPCPKCGKSDVVTAIQCPLCKRLALPAGHGSPPKTCPNCKKPWPYGAADKK